MRCLTAHQFLIGHNFADSIALNEVNTADGREKQAEQRCEQQADPESNLERNGSHRADRIHSAAASPPSHSARRVLAGVRLHG